MMKKLLVLSLVLAVVGLANAGFTVSGLDLSVIDNEDGTFGISSATGYVGGKDLYFALVGLGNPTGGVVLAAAPGAPLPSGSNINDDAVSAGGIGWLPAGVNGVWGYIGDADSGPKAAGLWFDGIVATGRVELYEINADWTGFTTTEPIAFAGVPEPMTMGLLSLGALFLRKRK